MRDGLFGTASKGPVEALNNELEAIISRARNGDERASQYLVSLALYINITIREILATPEGPGSEVLSEIATQELNWPCSVSLTPCFNSEPAAILKHLEEIKLGTRLNFKTKNFDQRTRDYIPAVIAMAQQIQKRGKVTLERNGLTRDEWLASETGKLVKKEARELLGARGLFSRHLEIQFKPIIDIAIAKAERTAEKRSATIRGKGPMATRRAVETAIVKEVSSLIYGVLSE